MMTSITLSSLVAVGVLGLGLVRLLEESEYIKQLR